MLVKVTANSLFGVRTTYVRDKDTARRGWWVFLCVRQSNANIEIGHDRSFGKASILISYYGFDAFNLSNIANGVRKGHHRWHHFRNSTIIRYIHFMFADLEQFQWRIIRLDCWYDLSMIWAMSILLVFLGHTGKWKKNRVHGVRQTQRYNEWLMELWKYELWTFHSFDELSVRICYNSNVEH